MPQLQSYSKQLQGVFGVGFITSSTMLEELGDLHRFNSARQLSRFDSPSPRQKSSGTSVRKHTQMSKQGSYRVRKVLYMAAMSAIQGQNDFGDFYRQLLAQGKTDMAALGAVLWDF